MFSFFSLITSISCPFFMSLAETKSDKKASAKNRYLKDIDLFFYRINVLEFTVRADLPTGGETPDGIYQSRNEEAHPEQKLDEEVPRCLHLRLSLEEAVRTSDHNDVASELLTTARRPIPFSADSRSLILKFFDPELSF
jgi:hypothetical protein